MRIYIIVRKYKLTKKHRLLKVIIVLLLLFGAILAYYYLRIMPLITNIVIENTRMKVSKAIDDMTDLQLQNTKYEDFVIVRYDENGKITFFQVNSVNVDLFARKVTALIRDEMSLFESNGIKIPIGTVSGIPFLSDLGPELTLNVLNLGVVDADFSSDFSDAGMNQTVHRLYMKIIVSMKIILPGYSLSFNNSSTVIICESVIVGDVPFGDINASLGG